MKPANPLTCIPYPLARRRFLALVSGGLLAAPLPAQAQPAGNVWRIGLVSVAYLKDEDIFFQRLRELGYVEGRISSWSAAIRKEGQSDFQSSLPN